MARHFKLSVALIVLILASKAEARKRGGGGLKYIAYCFVFGCPWWGWLLTALAIAIPVIAVIAYCYCKSKADSEPDVQDQQVNGPEIGPYHGVYGRPMTQGQPPQPNYGQTMEPRQPSSAQPPPPYSKPDSLQGAQQPKAAYPRQQYTYSQNVRLED